MNLTDGKKPLTQFLAEVVNWEYDQFCRQALDIDSQTTGEAMVYSMIFSCINRNLKNIKQSINRLDGLQPVQIQLELPRVFLLYPLATPTEKQKSLPPPVVPKSESKPQDTEPQKLTREYLMSLSMRETLTLMSQSPAAVPRKVIDDARRAERYAMGKDEFPPEDIPLVKSVMVAHLLELGRTGFAEAIEELFDSIDGRLAEVVKVGEDIYLTSYDKVAPEDALPNSDGVLMIEATSIQTMWGKALQKGKVPINE